MFQKNFDAQKNQDQTTDKFCFAFIFASEEVANDNSDDREYKGCDTNNTNCFNDRSIKKSNVMPTASASMLVATARTSMFCDQSEHL